MKNESDGNSSDEDEQEHKSVESVCEAGPSTENVANQEEFCGFSENTKQEDEKNHLTGVWSRIELWV